MNKEIPAALEWAAKCVEIVEAIREYFGLPEDAAPIAYTATIALRCIPTNTEPVPQNFCHMCGSRIAGHDYDCPMNEPPQRPTALDQAMINQERAVDNHIRHYLLSEGTRIFKEEASVNRIVRYLYSFLVFMANRK